MSLRLRTPWYTVISCVLALFVEWLLHRGTDKASTILGVAILLAFVLVVAFVEMNLLMQRNMLILETPRNNTIWLVHADQKWAEYGSRYHGGRIMPHMIGEHLAKCTVIASAFSDEMLAALGRIYELNPQAWSRREDMATFEPGDYVMVVHGDPATALGGPEARNHNFWIELFVVDKPSI